MKIVYLKPRSAFHNVIDSDMLWGLLLTILRMMFSKEKTDEIVQQSEEGNPPFLLTNCFTYYEDEKNNKNLQFPKILLPNIKKDELSEEQRKKYEDIDDKLKRKDYKKVDRIGKDDFIKIINGEKTEFDLMWDYYQSSNNAKDTAFNKRIIQETTVHTTIDRLTNVTAEDESGSGLLYTTEDTYIVNGGLFFLVDGDFSIIEPALNFLNHYGIAADVSTGKGHFEVSWEDFELPVPNNPTHFVTLSGYLPTEEEITNFTEDKTFYEFKSKVGKISTVMNFTDNYYKKEVFYFDAGSVFPWMNKKVYGRLKEVARVNDMSIKFNGYAFAVPAIIK